MPSEPAFTLLDAVVYERSVLQPLATGVHGVPDRHQLHRLEVPVRRPYPLDEFGFVARLERCADHLSHGPCITGCERSDQDVSHGVNVAKPPMTARVGFALLRHPMPGTE